MLESLSRRKRYAALAAVLALTTACSDDPPAPDPIAAARSTSTTPTATPSPSGPPTMPPAATGTSRRSAVAFVHHVIDVLNYSAASLDSSVLAKLSTQDCRACQGIISRTDEIRAAAGQIEGGAWRAVESTALRGGNGRLRQVQVVVDYAPQKLIESKEAQVKRYPGGRTLYTFDLERQRVGWLLQGVRGVAQD